MKLAIVIWLTIILLGIASYVAMADEPPPEYKVYLPTAIRIDSTWDEIDPDCGPYNIWSPEILICFPWLGG